MTLGVPRATSALTEPLPERSIQSCVHVCEETLVQRSNTHLGYWTAVEYQPWVLDTNLRYWGRTLTLGIGPVIGVEYSPWVFDYGVGQRCCDSQGDVASWWNSFRLKNPNFKSRMQVDRWAPGHDGP